LIAAGSARALTPVGGVPMVVRAVRAVLAAGLVDRVTIVTPDVLRSGVERACAEEPVGVRPPAGPEGVGAHTVQRPDGTPSDAPVTGSGDEVVLLHDACRPLAPSVLAAAVVAAVRGGHAMAVPVLALPDTVKRVDDRRVVTGTPDRTTLRVLQTPIAARARLLPPAAATDPLAAVRRHTAAGGTAHTVPGHPAAFAVHSEWDLELAELVAAGKILL
jgi:2-C-methyl-D-erythritol 4-phosphate cytidylyltransferase